MSLDDLIVPSAVVADLPATSKKQVLQDLSEKAAQFCALPAREIFNILLQRERLGSTGVGSGIAIPHGKSPLVDHIFGFFARLARPIDFESMDGNPVDLVFMIIAPEAAGADHLKALSRVARFLRDPATAARLRNARDATALYAMMVQEPASHAA